MMFVITPHVYLFDEALVLIYEDGLRREVRRRVLLPISIAGLASQASISRDPLNSSILHPSGLGSNCSSGFLSSSNMPPVDPLAIGRDRKVSAMIGRFSFFARVTLAF